MKQIITYLFVLTLTLSGKAQSNIKNLNQQDIIHEIYKSYDTINVGGKIDIKTFRSSNDYKMIEEMSNKFDNQTSGKNTIYYLNNAFLTPTKIIIEQTLVKGEKVLKDEIQVDVTYKDDLQIWVKTRNNKKDSIVTKFPTVCSLMYLELIPKFDYSKKGVISKFNLIDLPKFKTYRENVELVYEEDYLFKYKNKEIRLKRVRLEDRLTFWLDEKNNVVIMSMDDSMDKTIYRDFETIDEYATYDSVFRNKIKRVEYINENLDVKTEEEWKKINGEKNKKN